MSDNLARARARKAAGEWLSGQTQGRDPDDAKFGSDQINSAFVAGYLERIHHDVLSADEFALTARVLDEAGRGGLFTRSDAERAARAMLAARDRIGAIEDEHTIRVAEGQRQLDDAASLMREAVDLFRSYEKHHKGEAFRLHCGSDVHRNRMAKAETNALMAARLEAWLRGEDFYPIKPGALSPADHSAQEAFVSAALDAGVDQIGEADEPAFTPDRNHPLYDTACKVDPASLEGVDHHTVEDCRQRFENAAPFAGFPGGDFAEAKAMAGGVAIVMPGDPPLNPIDIIREVAEGMVDGDLIKGVDGPSFDRAREYMDQPVEISALDAPTPDAELIMLKERRDATLTPVERERNAACAEQGFVPWFGGDGPPADLDRDKDVLLDWGEDQNYPWPRFTPCAVKELTPEPGLWGERDPLNGQATIIGYRAGDKVIEFKEPISTPPTTVKGVIEYPTPADALAGGAVPASLVAAEPDPLAALVHARNWLISAESLIAEASAFIRGVTGANPGSDSEDICKRLDAWLCPLATAPAEPTKED